MEPHAVRRVYGDGVDAVVRCTADFDDEDWARRVCGSWSAIETVRHLAAVADWYHEWLDRAIEGARTKPFDATEIDVMTERSLATCSHLDGPDAVEQFSSRATEYLDRLDGRTDLPYTYPFGHVTAGLHAGVAAAEWHLHAWDLSGATPTRHDPAEPDLLFVAAGRCVAAAEGGIKGAVMSRLLPIAARRSPWQQILRQSGRA